jgi:hypothetical protein
MLSRNSSYRSVQQWTYQEGENEENERAEYSFSLDYESLSEMFNSALASLPVDISEFVELSTFNASLIFTENIVNRLIVVLLNEQDKRISNKVSYYYFF